MKPLSHHFSPKLIATLSTVITASTSMADVIQRESFEGTTAPIHSSTGLISAPTQFHGGPRDFWTATTGTSPTIYTGLDESVSYTGQDGTRYWAGQDLNDNGGDGLATKTLDFGPINITGFNNLNFTGLFAADGSYNDASPFRYDPGEGLEVYWSIDGSPFVKALAFECELETGINGRILKDIDLNGVGEGAILGTTFESHGFAIPNTGSTLTIRLIADLDSSQEEVAFDDLTIEGDPVVGNLAPEVNSINASNVAEPEIGETSYSFTVVYSDDMGVDAATIDANDVTVNGISMDTGSTTDSTGSPLTATYTFTPPGGSWDAADNGIYTISVAAGEVGDNFGAAAFVASGVIGSFNVDATNLNPVVESTLAPHVTAVQQGATSYAFQVTYADGGNIDASTIDVSDVTVTGPGGSLAVTSGTTSDPNGSSVTATYTFTPPGGDWDPADDGNYTISTNAAEVSDLGGAFVAAGLAGSFDADSTCAVREGFEAPFPAFDSGLVSAPDRFSAGPLDFWSETDGSNIDSASGSPASYSGEEGTRYWAGQDIDHVDDGLDTVEIGPIPVSGFTNLSFSGLFAADGLFTGDSNQPRYDPGEGIEIAWSIDGSPFTTALAFKSELSAGINGNILQDTDFDGIGDGNILSPEFSPYSFPIPTTGTNLTIRVTGFLDGSQEEVAFDDIKVNGTPSAGNTAPVANSVVAPNIGEPEIGETSYSFTVTYSDDLGVDATTIDAGDVTVNGIAMTTGTTADPTGSPLTATYTFTPPGGDWDAADNGSYTISVGTGEVGDNSGTQLFVAAGNIGSFEVNATNAGPVVESTLAPHVTFFDRTDTSYVFQVTYTDGADIDTTTIDASDVSVSGPGGSLTVTAGTTSDPNGSSVTAIYTATPPGDEWDPADDGSYTISIAGSQILDLNGGSVAAGPVGSFDVDSTCAVREGFEAPFPAFDSGLVSAPDRFSAGPLDFWTETDGSNIDSGSGSPALYSGKEGSRYWAGQDIDHVDDGLDTVEIGPIPISGFTGLSFSGLFAADGLFAGNPALPRYDPGEGIEIDWSIDGGPFTTALAFKSDLTTGINGNISKDTDLNGVGDGDILGPIFSSHSFPIPSTGANLTIRITGILDGSQEEVAFDDIKVSGTPPAVPVASPDDIARFPTQSVKVPIATLLGNDLDGGAPSNTITSVTPSGSGAAVSISGGNVFYSPNGVTTSDTFTYTVQNGVNQTDTGTVTVSIITDNSPASNITSMVVTGSGATKEVDISFAGIPGRTYRIQVSPDMTNWTDSGATITADAQGRIIFNDPPPVPATRFYRTVNQQSAQND